MNGKMNIVIVIFLLLIVSCSKSIRVVNTIESKNIILYRTIKKLYEDNEKYIIITDQNEIIESSKIGTDKLHCTKVAKNKIYKFEVTFLHDLFNAGGTEFDDNYYINDSITLKNDKLYFSNLLKKYCN